MPRIEPQRSLPSSADDTTATADFPLHQFSPSWCLETFELKMQLLAVVILLLFHVQSVQLVSYTLTGPQGVLEGRAASLKCALSDIGGTDTSAVWKKNGVTIATQYYASGSCDKLAGASTSYTYTCDESNSGSRYDLGFPSMTTSENGAVWTCGNNILVDTSPAFSFTFVNGVDLGENCIIREQCVTNADCISGTCQCSSGHLPVSTECVDEKVVISVVCLGCSVLVSAGITAYLTYGQSRQKERNRRRGIEDEVEAERNRRRGIEDEAESERKRRTDVTKALKALQALKGRNDVKGIKLCMTQLKKMRIGNMNWINDDGEVKIDKVLLLWEALQDVQNAVPNQDKRDALMTLYPCQLLPDFVERNIDRYLAELLEMHNDRDNQRLTIQEIQQAITNGNTRGEKQLYGSARRKSSVLTEHGHHKHTAINID